MLDDLQPSGHFLQHFGSILAGFLKMRAAAARTNIIGRVDDLLAAYVTGN